MMLTANSSIANAPAQLASPRLRPPAGAPAGVELEPDPVELLLELALVSRGQVLLHKVAVGDLHVDRQADRRRVGWSQVLQCGRDPTGGGRSAYLHGGRVDDGVQELVVLGHLLWSDDLGLASVALVVVQ